MPSYDFTLIIEGADLQTDAAQDALYEAGCDDATFGVSAGVQHATFSRQASSFEEALGSAITAVEGAVPGARVRRVEPDELVTLADIAERTGRTRESVRLLTVGARGPGGFPPPLTRFGAHRQLWPWAEVQRWLVTSLGEPAPDPESSAMRRQIVAVNAALELRRALPGLSPEERRVVDQLLPA